MTQRLQGRLALITGASRGIGAAAAKRFAEEGAELILVARTVGGLEEVDDVVRAAGSKATLVPLDLSENHERIDQLGATLAERFGKLDVLVGNAALLGEIAPIAHADHGVWDKVITTNLTANWRLLRSMHPLLAQSDAGRAMFVTSGVAGRIAPYWGAYAASKSALENMVQNYAAENAQSSIKANLIDPGRVATNMRAAAFPSEDPATLPSTDAITDRFVELAEAGCMKNGERVSV